MKPNTFPEVMLLEDYELKNELEATLATTSITYPNRMAERSIYIYIQC